MYLFPVFSTSLSLFLCDLSVAIQCLESAYEIDTSDEYTVSRYQVQRNLLDIFNTQLGIEVSLCCFVHFDDSTLP